MKTINHYTAVIVMKVGIIRSENSFKMEKEKILGENESFICIDNEHFDKVAKAKNWKGIFAFIDHPSISIYNNDRCFGSMVRYSLYTHKEKRASTIKKEIERKIDKEYGWLGKINLDFIK